MRSQEIFNYLLKWGSSKTKEECFNYWKFFVNRDKFEKVYDNWLSWWKQGGYVLTEN